MVSEKWLTAGKNSIYSTLTQNHHLINCHTHSKALMWRKNGMLNLSLVSAFHHQLQWSSEERSFLTAYGPQVSQSYTLSENLSSSLELNLVLTLDLSISWKLKMNKPIWPTWLGKQEHFSQNMSGQSKQTFHVYRKYWAHAYILTKLM